MGERVLSLETLVERPTVCIDKVDYPLKLPQDFGLIEIAHIQQMQDQVNALLAAGDQADTDALVRVLDQLVGMVLAAAPAAVLARLRDMQKLAIVQAFQRAAEQTLAGPPPIPASPPTGAS